MMGALYGVLKPCFSRVSTQPGASKACALHISVIILNLNTVIR